MISSQTWPAERYFRTEITLGQLHILFSVSEATAFWEVGDETWVRSDISAIQIRHVNQWRFWRTFKRIPPDEFQRKLLALIAQHADIQHYQEHPSE